MWLEFSKKHSENLKKAIPISFCFCDNEKDANECADLVIRGIKQVTATSLWLYKKNNESLPNIGDQYIVTDWNGTAKTIIQATKIEQIPYKEITVDFARTEGEGDKSLKYWKRVHKAYYTREMEPYGDEFSEDMIIVCEYFERIH